MEECGLSLSLNTCNTFLEFPALRRNINVLLLLDSGLLWKQNGGHDTDVFVPKSDKDVTEALCLFRLGF